MHRILLCLMLWLPALALAAPPAPFAAEYDVYQNDRKLGTGSITLRALPGGRWELHTRSTATQGLAGAAGVRREERSVMRWTGRQLEAVDYTMEQKAAWNTRSQRLQVDAGARAARSTYKGESVNLPYQAGMLERHGLTAAIMADLAAGRRGELSYVAAERRGLETQRYVVAASVRLRTSIGVLRAVRVERIRHDGSGRTTKIWFARERGWLPLRIKQYESDGETIDMRITAIR